jgi:hypothetical protein
VTVANPLSVANVDANYEQQLQALAAAALAEFSAGSVGNQVTWYRPAGWNGNPFDYAGLQAAFQRTQANTELLAALKDANNPGVTGDVVACSTEIALMSVLGRAFVVRQTLRRPRATAHQLGRRRGQGDQLGTFTQLGIEYIRSVLRQAKQAQT